MKNSKMMIHPKMKHFTVGITVNYYTDSSHGWIAVKRQLLQRLNLLEKISSYSYTKGKTVYLEEDRDATLFLDTAKQHSIRITVKGPSRHKNARHPIRSYDRYTQPTL